MVVHPLYRDGISILVNQAKWKALPEDAKKVMYQAAAKTQAWAHDFVAEQQAAQVKKMKAAGMQMIEFSPAESKRWTDTSRSALWAHFKSVMSAEDYATARRLLGEK
jgi:TRAP-type C4-dicarboxylate transport system substrate-binding protein